MADKIYIDGSRVVLADDTTGVIKKVGVIHNGWNGTGYTEPFFAPESITTGASLATIIQGQYMGTENILELRYLQEGKQGGYARFGDNPTEVNNDFAGNSVYYHYGYYATIAEEAAATEDVILTGDSKIFDGLWVTGDFSGLVRNIRRLANGNYMVNITNESGANQSITATAGTYLRPEARTVDVGAAVASRDYVAGELVQEVYPQTIIWNA